VIRPDWQVPANVRAFVSTRDFGDLREQSSRRKLAHMLPGEPAWLRQIHGQRVIDLDTDATREGDAAVTRKRGTVCVVQAADCMPVLLTDTEGSVVAAAHAGWRGLAAGVVEATIEAMRVPRNHLIAWLGPAIGPRVYEVGEDVMSAFRGYERAFTPARPRHWLLDLYAVARAKLAGLKAVTGGDFCTYSEAERFFSYRRERTPSRMGAFIWLA
jgi:YfiH family protein